MKKFLSIALLIALVATMAIAANAGSGGQKYAKGDVVQVAAGSIAIDGVKDAAYANTAQFLANCDKLQGKGNVNNATSKTYVLWDGASLILFTEVKDSTPMTAGLAYYMTQSYDCDCMEYFIVWDNSDCPTVQEFQDPSSDDLFHYRATFTNGTGNGYFVSISAEGFADGSETGSPFSTKGGEIKSGIVKPTNDGYNVEMEVVLATANKKGAGSYTYANGSKIAICSHFFDFWGGVGNYDKMTILYSDPTGDTKTDSVMKSAWQVKDYWYVELQGEGTTPPPADTDAPVTVDPATALANAKTNAIAEIDALVAGKTYSTFNQKNIDSYVANAKDAINAAADAAEVASVLADAKTAISAVPYSAGTTAAPATDDKKPSTAPQTSDMAVAGIAILATLALAGVVVAKKVK